jgi:hypothetical protein
MSGLVVHFVPPNRKYHLNPFQYLRKALSFCWSDKKVEMIRHDTKVPEFELETFYR